ncbi:MAG TPA: glucoamylase family protein [Candidatus Limnocylindrales bacterium]|nr:glucoamylase family protein [Candidatus Limnocylindrales bacterium]
MALRGQKNRFTRRDLLRVAGKAAIGLPVLGFEFFAAGCGSGGNASSSGTTLTDDQLLAAIEQANFQFFWNQASPTTGLVKDRAVAQGTDSSTVASIAATGFGLTALCIGDSRGYLPAAQLKQRVLAALNFLLTVAPVENGFFYHFMDINTGARAGTSEVSSIDTAILLCGILMCRAYFQDTQITSLANQIYQRINWSWMLNGGTTLSQGWTPENGFLPTRWDTYSELMMLYLLAIGAPANPIPASSWDAWSRPTLTYQGLTYITGNAPLFIHQYSHAWIDFRNKQDAYANYFQNSITATQAHKLFCLSLASQFPDYTNNFWGISSSDSVNGYVAWGGPPEMGLIDGSIVPSASAGSVPFLPTDTLAVLRNLYTKYAVNAWTQYGFIDAFNPLTGWIDADVLGIDLGITMLMAENYRTQFVWNTFMQNTEITNAMSQVGFHAT